MPRVRLTVSYDGSSFRGFAANPGVTTVAGVLADAVERVVGHRITLSVAGRTDAGVHAWGQVVSMDLPEGADLGHLRQSVNALCGPEVVVRDAVVVDDRFDARFSARWRRYRYTIVNRPEPDPFLARYSWHVPQPLDLKTMTLACDPLIGEHDFSSFCRRPKPSPGKPAPSLVRRVLDAYWDDDGEGVLRFWITASSFCQQMVRSITGTLVEIGSGRRSAGEMAGIRRAGDRAAAGSLAPPHGLCLWEVGY